MAASLYTCRGTSWRGDPLHGKGDDYYTTYFYCTCTLLVLALVFTLNPMVIFKGSIFHEFALIGKFKDAIFTNFCYGQYKCNTFEVFYFTNMVCSYYKILEI